NVPDSGGDLLPILPTGRQSMQNDWCSRSHMDAVVRSMLMAGGDDVLRQSGARQVEGAVWIRKNSSPLGRGDLKGRVAHPFHFNRCRSSGRNPQEWTLYDLQFVTEAEDAGRESQQQNQKREVLRS